MKTVPDGKAGLTSHRSGPAARNRQIRRFGLSSPSDSSYRKTRESSSWETYSRPVNERGTQLHAVHHHSGLACIIPCSGRYLEPRRSGLPAAGGGDPTALTTRKPQSTTDNGPAEETAWLPSSFQISSSDCV